MSERIDDLQYKGLRILQDTEEFCFGCDAVELANFADMKSGRLAYDLGAGTGIIAVLVAAKKGVRVRAIESNPVTAELCRRSVEMNGQTAEIETYTMRAQDCPQTFGRDADYVLANPPYFKTGTGRMHDNPSVACARHELTLSLAELTETAAALLQTGGAFYTVYPAERLAEVLTACSARRLEPKILQMLTPGADKSPHLFLLKCVYGGRPGLKILPERPVRAFGVQE